MARQQLAMGWQRDLPDIRDYNSENREIRGMLAVSKRLNDDTIGLQTNVDLSSHCSPIEDQESIGSCTAQAGVGLIEYYEKRAFGQHLNASRLFLYKTTRNLLGWTGDTGGYLRTTMQAMRVFGVPPEKYLKYDISRYDEEPSAFLYSFAQSYQSIRYYRLDQPGTTPEKLKDRVIRFLDAGLPSMFGFTVYNFGNERGEFAFPSPGDSVQGGHAIVAIGYDDNRQIGDSVGALKIRNSWGTGWGEGGYGWLPYDYVTEGLAVDFWSLFKLEYVESGNFE